MCTYTFFLWVNIQIIFLCVAIHTKVCVCVCLCIYMHIKALWSTPASYFLLQVQQGRIMQAPSHIPTIELAAE